MYPTGELNRLAARKLIMHQRIAASRWEMSEAFARVSEPFGVVDTWIARWRRWSPLIKLGAIPASIWFGKILSKRMSWLTPLMQFAPMVFRAARATL